MVVKEGAPKPDISSVDASPLGAARRQVDRSLFDSGGGTNIANVMYAKLGIADQVAGKSRKVRGPPSGEPVAAVVARAARPRSTPAGQRADPHPGRVHRRRSSGRAAAGLFVFGGADRRGKGAARPAKALIGFLASPESAAVVTWMGPAADREAVSGARRLRAAGGRPDWSRDRAPMMSSRVTSPGAIARAIR